MQLIENLFKVSGLEYGTCSNNYAVDAGDSLILIDAGTDERQYGIIRNNLDRWNLSDKPLTHVLLTHSHFDHSGNAFQFQKDGAKLVIGSVDGEAIRTGGEGCLEKLFGMTFNRAKPDIPLDGDTSFTVGSITVEAYSAPGHTAGGMAYVLTLPSGFRALAAGDMMAIPQTTPQSEYMIDMGAVGLPGFDADEYLLSVEKLSHVQADLLLTGHWGVVFSDTRVLFRKLLEISEKTLRG